MARVAIGIDLGGTFIKAGVVSLDGKIVGRATVPTDVPGGRAVIISNIALAAETARKVSSATWRDICAIGLGSPGLFKPPRGLVNHSPNLKCLEGKELAQPVAKALGRLDCPVVLENDANVAAYAESWLGAGRDVDTLALMTLGTGIGGGIILNGEIWRGAWGTAAELGHQNLFPDGYRCGCGNKGCLEAYASATGLVRRFREAVQSGQSSRLAVAVREGKDVTARDIATAAKGGDALSLAIMEETGRYLGIAVMNMVHILNVERVEFAGGMAAAGKLLLNPIRAEARKRSFPLAYGRLKIMFSRMGNDAGLLGAAGWALRQTGHGPGKGRGRRR